jgi:hypothetical protein
MRKKRRKIFGWKKQEESKKRKLFKREASELSLILSLFDSILLGECSFTNEPNEIFINFL